MAEVIMTFNGESRPYLRVLHDLKRSSWAPISRELLQVPGVAGAYLTGTRTEVREITVPVMLVGTSYEDLQTLKEDLAAWLVHEEAKELTFSDEPNRTYYALIEGGFEAEDIVKHGKGTLRFVCPDPYKYGEEVTVAWPELDTVQTDFKGKVAGSTVENPHLSKTAGLSFLGIPTLSDAAHELTDSNYSRIISLNGSSLAATRTNYGSQGNLVFSFNLISLIERQYGYPLPGWTTADKVAWLKANITRLTANWHGKGTNKQANPTGIANFAGKVSESTTANPHISKRRAAPALETPSGTWVELLDDDSQLSYKRIDKQDGNLLVQASGTPGAISHVIFSFDLIEYVQRKYGVTVPGATTADKVQWLKDNVVKFACNWHGFGAGIGGNKASLRMWNVVATTWVGTTSHALSTVSRLTVSNAINWAHEYVDSNGFVHFLAYAEASDGTTASTINTDYVELEVELKAGQDKANFTAWNGSAWNSPVVHAGNAIGLKSYSPGTIPLYIDSDGFAHFLAYSEPSNGISPSTIETDYIELQVTLRKSHVPITIVNEGTADAKPTVNLQVTRDTTFAMLQNGVEDYMLIGEPVEVEATQVEGRTLLWHEDGSTLDSWSEATPAMGDQELGDSDGVMMYDGSGITTTNYGTGGSHHGPFYYITVPTSADFEVELRGQLTTTSPVETGRLGFTLFDDQVRNIAMMNAMDNFTQVERKKAESRVGPFIGWQKNYPISGRNYEYNWNDFPAYLRLRRIGDTFEFYIARVLPDGMHTMAMTKYWTITDATHRGPLRYVGIFLEKYGNTPNPLVNRIDYVKAWAINEVTEDQTPYIARAGDVITFNHQTRDVLINGIDRTDLKSFGARYFALEKGTNTITVAPASTFAANITYRERFK